MNHSQCKQEVATFVYEMEERSAGEKEVTGQGQVLGVAQGRLLRQNSMGDGWELSISCSRRRSRWRMLPCRRNLDDHASWPLTGHISSYSSLTLTKS